MKLLKRKFIATLALGFGLLASVGAHADTETGELQLTTFATGLFTNDGAVVRLADADPLKSGRCNDNGAMLFLLDGEASKATLTALVAAYAASKTVTVQYQYDDLGGECLLASVTFN